MRLAPVELEPDALADALLRALDRTGARRLIIDSIVELDRAVAEASGPGRVAGYLAALVEALRDRHVTTLALRENATLVASEVSLASDTLTALAENVLLLQHLAYRGQLHRVISVPKMRFSAHDLQVREFIITPPEGIRVLSPLESVADVLSAIMTRQGGGSGVPPTGTPAETEFQGP